MQNKLGNVLTDRLAIGPSPETADAALAAYERAEEVQTAESYPEEWERLQLYKVQVLFTIGTPTMDRARLEAARDIATKTNAKLKEIGAPNSGFFDQMLPMLEQILGMLPQ